MALALMDCFADRERKIWKRRRRQRPTDGMKQPNDPEPNILTTNDIYINTCIQMLGICIRFFILLLPHAQPNGKEKLLWVGFELVSTTVGDLNAYSSSPRHSRHDIKTHLFVLSFFLSRLTRAPPVYYTVTTLR